MAFAVGMYFLGVQFLASIAYQMVAYVSMLFLPRKMGQTVTITIGVTVCSILHIYQQIVHENTFGVSSHLMASFVRQYVISCNFVDGAADPKHLTSRE
jgi:hypothetical protein